MPRGITTGGREAEQDSNDKDLHVKRKRERKEGIRWGGRKVEVRKRRYKDRSLKKARK